MSKELGGIWRTIGGRRVFIKDGQDLASAMKESGKFNIKQKAHIEKDREIWYNKIGNNDKNSIGGSGKGTFIEKIEQDKRLTWETTINLYALNFV